MDFETLVNVQPQARSMLTLGLNLNHKMAYLQYIGRACLPSCLRTSQHSLTFSGSSCHSRRNNCVQGPGVGGEVCLEVGTNFGRLHETLRDAQSDFFRLERYHIQVGNLVV